jgi:hypothetical protein
VARLLPPESSAVADVSSKIGISVATLERWRAEYLARASGEQPHRWTPAARLKAVIAYSRDGSGGPQCLVPRARRVPHRAGCLEARRGRRPWRAGRREPGGQAGQPPHQGSGARVAPQGQGLGRNGRLACVIRKTPGVFHEGEDA